MAPYVAMDLLVISPEMSAYEMEREARVARNNVYLEVIYRPVHRMSRFTVLSQCMAVVCCSSVPVYPSLCRPQDRVNAECRMQPYLPQQLYGSFGTAVFNKKTKPRYTSLSLDHLCHVHLAPYVGRSDLSVHICILTPCAPDTCTSTKIIFDVRYSFCSVQFSSSLHHSSSHRD